MREYRVLKYRGQWAAEYKDPATGKRRRRSLGTDVQGEVERKLAILNAELEREARPAVATIEYAWNGKVASLGNRPAARNMRYLWVAMGPFWGHRPCDSVTEELCNEWRALRRSQGISDSTVWLDLSRLRAALIWAQKKELISKAPFVWKPPAPKPRDKRLTREQAQKFIAACEADHMRLFAIVALSTAARCEAILGLTWDRVDFDARRINFKDPLMPPTAKQRAEVPMNETAFQALSEARQKATTPYVIEWHGDRVRDVRMGLKGVGERCGLPWVTSHVFRHTAATLMAAADVPMVKIAQYLGHRDSRITEQVYARFSPSYLKGAAQALEL